jgi:cyanate permease
MSIIGDISIATVTATASVILWWFMARRRRHDRVADAFTRRELLTAHLIGLGVTVIVGLVACALFAMVCHYMADRDQPVEHILNATLDFGGHFGLLLLITLFPVASIVAGALLTKQATSKKYDVAFQNCDSGIESGSLASQLRGDEPRVARLEFAMAVSRYRNAQRPFLLSVLAMLVILFGIALFRFSSFFGNDSSTFETGVAVVCGVTVLLPLIYFGRMVESAQQNSVLRCPNCISSLAGTGRSTAVLSSGKCPVCGLPLLKDES